MRLQDRLKDDLRSAIKMRNESQKEALRVVIGEMARLDKKTFADDEVVGMLKKLIKSEKELLAKSSQANTSPFIEVLETYLPQMATEEEIHQWIAANIDFGAYKNKMQAMGAIMAYFGAGADGNLVKRVLQAYPA